MASDLTIIPIETPTLGDRSYLVHDGEVAFVVDPQRDIDRVLSLLDEHAVRLRDVFETHIHNDYPTGAWPWPSAPAPRTTSTPPTTSPSTAHRSATVRWSRWVSGCGSRSWLRPATPSRTCPTC